MRLTGLAAAACLALGALGACHPAPEAAKDAATSTKPAADATAPKPDADAAPPATPIAVKPVSFDPLSKTAEAVTGALSLSVLPQPGPKGGPATRMEASNGTVYETELIPRGAEEATTVDWSALFGTKISFEPNAPADIPSVDLHAISAETVSAKAPNGGFCGKEKTRYIAMAVPITTPTGITMSIAAFKGEAWPPTATTALCGVYTYDKPH
jgi:hypothetical protein